MEPQNLRTCRTDLRLMQSSLARLSGVSRPRIVLYELGDRPITEQEQGALRRALQLHAKILAETAQRISLELG